MRRGDGGPLGRAIRGAQRDVKSGDDGGAVSPAAAGPVEACASADHHGEHEWLNGALRRYCPGDPVPPVVEVVETRSVGTAFRCLRCDVTEVNLTEERVAELRGQHQHDAKELCGAVFPLRPGQNPCSKTKDHEHGPDSDWKRELHSNGLLKWRVDGADLPATPPLWRFDVPEVPAGVTCFEQADGRLWVRNDAGRWVDWPEQSNPLGFDISELLEHAPLVECPDPRGTT